MSHTIIMLNWAYGPNIFATCGKTQPTAIPTSHCIAIHEPETHMSTILGLYARFIDYLMGTDNNNVSDNDDNAMPLPTLS